MRTIKILIIIQLAVLTLAPGWALGNKEKIPGVYADNVTTSQMGGNKRYLTHISTDKQIYKPGEPVYTRGVVLEAETNEPYSSYISASFVVEGPKGDRAAEGRIESSESVLGFRWMIPAGLPGGEYIIKINYSEYNYGFPPAERKIQIRSYRAPRLKTEITFLKDGYYPGDNVQAVCEIERAEGGIPSGATVNIIARVDSQEIHNSFTTVDNEGNSPASFNLPLNIADGEGTLVFIIEDGGVTESASKTIPILLDNFEIGIYPEGGDLVAELENRVYLEAVFRNGKPADISGTVIDSDGREAAAFSTSHEGRGSFTFIPADGKRYYLQLSGNRGEEIRYPMPEINNNGIVMKSLLPVYGKKDPLKFQLASPGNKNIRVVISKREKALVEKQVRLKAGKPVDIAVDLPISAQGILVVTLWAENKPVAERIIYREPKDSVNIEITPDSENPGPGDSITLQIKTTTGDGKPVSANIGLTVTDEAVLKMVEKRDEAPYLPAMVFLENDIKELADANVYLDPANPTGQEQLDLLLGTQGWRRFAFLNWNEFLATYGDKAKRVGALTLLIPAPQPEPAMDPFWGGAAEKNFPMARNAEDAVMVFEEDRMMEKAGPPPENPDPIPAGMDQPEGMLVQPNKDEAKIEMEEVLMEDLEVELFDKKRIAGQAGEIAVFRVYAHKRRTNWSPAKRIDFTETLYWHGGITTDPGTGKAEVSFDLNDSITSFRVLAEGFTPSGILGAEAAVLNSVKPVYIEPKMPLEVTRGDEITIPMALVNNTEQTLTGNMVVKLDNKAVKTIPVKLGAESRSREMINMQISGSLGEKTLHVQVDFGEYKDSVKRIFKVNAPGFPIEQNNGGMVGPNKPFSFDVNIPQTIINGSFETLIRVYPTPVANLTQALEALIRQPYGCFEQTSSTSYPLVMAQQYFMTHKGVDPDLIKRAKSNLDAAYGRLTGFESPEKGYEWFGGNPGHESLTAYGLMQFVEMKEVMEVDESMINRTRSWLLDRRDGSGGFKRNPQALDSFGAAPEETTNAYITWALLEAGQEDLEKEIELVREIAFKNEDSYIHALAANVLYKAGDKKGALALMDKLVKKQTDNGSIAGAKTSITRSGGDSLVVETTAVTLLAWMKEEKYAGNVELAMKYLVTRCQNGMFYSTQGTILALKAIILYDELRAKPKAGGTLEILVDNKSTSGEVVFTKETNGAIELPDISRTLAPGKHRITIRMTGGSEMPLSSTLSYASNLPTSSDQSSLDLKVKLADTHVKESGATELNVIVTNLTAGAVPTPVAILGLPGGMEPRHDQLKELVKAGTIDAYEVLGQEIVLYWRVIKASEERRFSISCIASLPGKFTGPASRVYAYYTAEHKKWVKGNTVTIIPNQ